MYPSITILAPLVLEEEADHFLNSNFNDKNLVTATAIIGFTTAFATNKAIKYCHPDTKSCHLQGFKTS